MSLKVGDRVGRLVLVTGSYRLHGTAYAARVRCDCGVEFEARYGNLGNGHTTSCGCHKVEKAGKQTITHGASKTKEYSVWLNMRRRCGEPSNVRWKYYGGRGIAVCSRWEDFSNFLADMGICPSGYSLERLDGGKGYEPANCIWASAAAQASNKTTTRRVVLGGESIHLAEAQRRTGIHRNSVRGRVLDYGETYQQALDHLLTRRQSAKVA